MEQLVQIFGAVGERVALLIAPALAVGTCNAGAELNTELECLECEPEILLMLG